MVYKVDQDLCVAEKSRVATLTSITFLLDTVAVLRSDSISFKRLVTVDVLGPGILDVVPSASSYRPPLLCRPIPCY